MQLLPRTSRSEDSGAQDASFSPTVKHVVIMSKNVFTFKTEEKLIAVICHFKPSWIENKTNDAKIKNKNL